MVDDPVQDGLFIYWGDPKLQGDSVYYAQLQTPSIDDTRKASKTLRIDLPGKVDDWKTPIGNAGVYGKKSTWIVSTAKDGHIWVAFGDDFADRADLTAQQAGSESPSICGACLVPGYFGKEWNLVVVYRGPDSQLHELRQLSKEEKLIEDLADQLALALDGKAKAEAEAKQCKADKEALQQKVTELEGEKAALTVDRDKYKGEKQDLEKKVAQLQKDLTTAVSDRDTCKAAKEALERQLAQLQANDVERSLLRSILLDLRTHCRDGVILLPFPS